MFKCSICRKCVSDSCPSILCDNCDNWVHHPKCSGLNSTQFEALSQPNSSNWFCPKCLNSILPFPSSPAETPKAVRPSRSNLSDELKSLLSDLNTINNDHNNIIETDSANFSSTSCKYMEYQDFNMETQNTKSNFSTLHLNISSMSKHFDEFCTLLSLLQHNFTFIGISETRFLKNQEPTSNFSIPGYKSVSTPTESSAGGVLLYISNSVSYKPRPDLNKAMYDKNNLESVFVEVTTPKNPT